MNAFILVPVVEQVLPERPKTEVREKVYLGEGYSKKSSLLVFVL